MRKTSNIHNKPLDLYDKLKYGLDQAYIGSLECMKKCFQGFSTPVKTN